MMLGLQRAAGNAAVADALARGRLGAIPVQRRWVRDSAGGWRWEPDFPGDESPGAMPDSAAGAAPDPVRIEPSERAMFLEMLAEAFEQVTAAVGDAPDDSLLAAISLLRQVRGEHATPSHGLFSAGTRHFPRNLAQSEVDDAGNYEAFENTLKDVVRDYRVDGGTLLRLVLAPDAVTVTKTIDSIFDRFPSGSGTAKGKGKKRAREDSPEPDQGRDAKRRRTDDGRLTEPAARRQLLAAVRLWHLESARRLAAGTANALMALRYLAGGGNALHVVTRHTMHADGASGKSARRSAGKTSRVHAMHEQFEQMLGQIPERLAPLLVPLRNALVAFVVAARRNGELAAAEAEFLDAVWHTEMPLHVTRKILPPTRAGTVATALQQLPEFATLRQAFATFMRLYYEHGAEAAASARGPAQAPAPAPEPPVSPFLLYLVRRAASGGHAAALDAVAPIDPAVDGIPELLRLNADPGDATAARHVAALRRMSRAALPAPLESVRIHADAPSRHVVVDFGAYDNEIPHVARLLDMVDVDARPAYTSRLLEVLAAPTLDDLDARLRSFRADVTEPYVRALRARLGMYSENRDAAERYHAASTGRLPSDKSAAVAHATTSDPAFRGRPNEAEVDRGLKAVRGLWKLLGAVEASRSAELTSLVYLVAEEGLVDGRPLTETEALITYNPMEVSARDTPQRQASVAGVFDRVRFSGPVSAAFAAARPGLASDDAARAAAARAVVVAELARFLRARLMELPALAVAPAAVPALPTLAVPREVARDGLPVSSLVTQVALTDAGFTVGKSDSLGNVCLIDTMRQIAACRGATVTTVELRANLVAALTGATTGPAAGPMTRSRRLGAEAATAGSRTPQQQAGDRLASEEMLEVYGDEGAYLIDHLTETYGFRVQILEVLPNGLVRAHDVRGRNGPLYFVRHQGLHFTPLWPPE